MAGAAGGPADRETGLGAPVVGQGGRAAVALLVVAAVWGSTFTVVKDAIELVPAADFLAIRFTLAALVMAVLRPSALRHMRATTVRHGIGLGVVLAGGYLAQTTGLGQTSAAAAGVLAGLVIVLVPVLGFTRLALGALRWAALGLGAAGVAVLALQTVGLGTGDWLVLAGSFVLAAHLVVVAQVADRHDLWTLTVVQLLVAATICAVIAAPSGITAPPDTGVWAAVILTAVVATAGAFMIQTWAQRRLDAVPCGILLASEPAFAVLVAVSFGDDALTWQVATAGAAVVAAMVLTELGAGRAVPAEVPATTT